MITTPSLVVDFSTIPTCKWCGARAGDGAYVFECPSCGFTTCRECVKIIDGGAVCVHKSPAERHVLTRQDWGDD